MSARTFRVAIETANHAFYNEQTDEHDPAPELARLLRRLADRLDAGEDCDGRALVDVNGNTVGIAHFTRAGSYKGRTAGGKVAR